MGVKMELEDYNRDRLFETTKPLLNTVIPATASKLHQQSVSGVTVAGICFPVCAKQQIPHSAKPTLTQTQATLRRSEG
jgi:hypothetical protein